MLYLILRIKCLSSNLNLFLVFTNFVRFLSKIRHSSTFPFLALNVFIVAVVVVLTNSNPLKRLIQSFLKW